MGSQFAVILAAILLVVSREDDIIDFQRIQRNLQTGEVNDAGLR